MLLHQAIITISAILFLLSYGFFIISIIRSESYLPIEHPYIIRTKTYRIRSYISGYILPVFGYIVLLDIKWFYLILINIPVALFFIPFITGIIFGRQSLTFYCILNIFMFYIGLIFLIVGYILLFALV
jgi:hypothetical protein